MATKGKPEKAPEKHPSNSKGFRKSYHKGVVGWQIYLEPLRMFVNINQYASAISAPKALIDYTLKGIVGQTKYLSIDLDPPVTIPCKLGGRKALAEKNGHPSYADKSADFGKALNMLVVLHGNKHMDTKGKALIKSACNNALSKASKDVNVTGRLRKKVAAL